MTLTAARPTDGLVRELDQRTGEGLEVTLLWNARTNCVSVSVVENWRRSSLQYEVAPADALDQFREAFAEAVQRREDALAA